MQCKFKCKKLDGNFVCGKEHYSSLMRVKITSTASQCPSTYRQKKRQKGMANQDRHSQQVCGILGSSRRTFWEHKSCAVLMEDLCTTNNFVTHTLAEGMNLPSTPLALSLKVLGNKTVIQDTRE